MIAGKMFGGCGTDLERPAGANAKERAVLKRRGVVSYLLLGIITGGIYSLWRVYVLARDVNTMCEGDGKKTSGLLAVFFLSLITFGIYAIVWEYKLGNRFQANAGRYGVTITRDGTTVLLWSLLGSFLFGLGPIIAMHIIFSNTNLLIDSYNQKSTTLAA